MLPRDPGPCISAMIRWHFSPIEERCIKFEYGGCEGNRNRFGWRVRWTVFYAVCVIWIKKWKSQLVFHLSPTATPLFLCMTEVSPLSTHLPRCIVNVMLWTSATLLTLLSQTIIVLIKNRANLFLTNWLKKMCDNFKQYFSYKIISNNSTDLWGRWAPQCSHTDTKQPF